MKLINSIFNVLRFNQRNWKAVVLCVFAATVFWFLNALNKTYTTNLRFPLRFEYDRETYVPVASLPREIRINVTGNGWDLFRRSAGLKIPPLEIPLERPMETRKIVGSTLPAYFTNQIEGLEINYVLTDTLYVDLEPKTSRWVHLVLDTTSLKIRKDYALASTVSILPDSIRIDGPRRVINEIADPVKVSLPFEDIDEHFMEDIEVVLPYSDLIKRNPPTVAVMFNVQKQVLVRDSVTLKIENLPSNVWPVMGRRKIPVTLSVPENMVDQFVIDSVSAVIDLKNIEKGSHMIKPRIDGLAPFQKVISVDSVNIKF